MGETRQKKTKCLRSTGNSQKTVKSVVRKESMVGIICGKDRFKMEVTDREREL